MSKVTPRPLEVVTRNADEIQTTFVGFLLNGRVIEIGDINRKENLLAAENIVKCVNYHERLVEALSAALNYISESPCDPDIYPAQLDAWGELTALEPHKLLAELEKEQAK